MSSKRAGRARKKQPRRFRPPLGLTYNEFVGELGPATGEFIDELHVRYGERDGLYLDWAITVVMRRGGLGEYMASGAASLERRRIRRYDVSEAGIRRHTYDPIGTPTVDVLRTLSAGDEEIVDQAYDEILTEISHVWNARYPDPDPHTTATFGFASANRRPEFRNRWPELMNTLVAVDPDVAEEVWVERGNAYFGNRKRSAAVLMPSRQEFKFIFTDTPINQQAEHQNDSTDRVGVHALQATMGMLADLVNRSPEWTDEQPS
ncbi:hypothetical protein [Nocardia sp. bgisy118]|uniref:hypothetical protein n=1 Tax=Nocardia sp. bgisy118 TaxID=3413786 RepID=UPI003F4A237A